MMISISFFGVSDFTSFYKTGIVAICIISGVPERTVEFSLDICQFIVYTIG